MNISSLTTLASALDDKFRAQCARLDLDQPWIGRLVVRTDAGESEYFIGSRTNAAEKIVDWRHPIGQAFYDLEPGDAFELARPFVERTGTVESRAAVKAEARRIRELDLLLRDDHIVLVASDGGFVDRDRVPTHRGAPGGLDDILGQLTRPQYRLITASRSAPLIIQGRAGSGKTSVGLYRLAWLTFAGPEADAPPISPAGVLVVMFNKGLQKFVQRTVERMNLTGVRLDTFHGWALEEVRRGYGGQIQPDTTRHPGRQNAIALKKQLGILRACEAFVARQAAALPDWLAAKLSDYDSAGAWLRRYQGLDAPVARRVALLRSAALRERDVAQDPAEQRRLTEVHRIFAQAMQRLTQYKEELFRLLTDRALIAAHLPNATAEQLDDLIRYQTALQQPNPADRRPGPNVAFEDLAILLRLMQLKHGGLPDKAHDDDVRTYDHVLIDEAQDFGAVELTAILASVRSRTGVTIVGDSNQKIIPEADFIGWDALAKELGVTGAAVARLEVAHRSTAPIMQLADFIVGDSSAAGRPGPRPQLFVGSPARAMEHVARIAREAMRENPSAHVCVVCPKPQDVEATVTALRGELAGGVESPAGRQAAGVQFPESVPLRVGYNDTFVFEPGVTVTNLRQIKGLEFDTVIALDVTDAYYPADEQGRKWLYTVVTRAKDALHLVSSETPCAVVRAAVERGLVEAAEAEIRPVVFTAEDELPL